EVSMNHRAVGELRVERRDQDAPFPGHDRLPAVLGQNLDARAPPPDPGRPDEDHLEGGRASVELHHPGGLERLALPAVGVALDGDVDEPQRELSGAFDLARQDDKPRTRAEDRPAAPPKLLERGREVPRVHELEQGRGLAPGDDEPVDLVQLGGLAHLDRLDAALLERAGVQREVALERKHSDAHARFVHRLRLVYGFGSPAIYRLALPAGFGSPYIHRLALPAAFARPSFTQSPLPLPLRSPPPPL